MKKITKAAFPASMAQRVQWLCILPLLALLPRLAGAQEGPASGTISLRSGPAIFLKAVTSRPSAYVGQPLTVSYLLYYRVPVVDPDNAVALKFNNCYVEEYPRAPEQRTATMGGQVYRVQLLKKYLLIPQVEGTLLIPVLTQRYRISGPSAPEDFFGEQKIVSTTVRSAALQVAVRALPPLPPDNLAPFCGAIGLLRFRPAYTVSRKADNLLTVRLEVTGSGSLKNMKLPPPPLPDGVDVFNAFGREQHTFSAKGLQSKGIYSYDVLANYRGMYTLPGIALQYFDPEAGRYLTYTTPAFHWQVTKGPPPHAPTASVIVRNRPPLYIISDLFEAPAGRLFFGSRLYYSLLFVAGLFFLTGILYTHRLNARYANNRSYQFRKAKSQALKAIKKNERVHFKDADKFYKGLHDVLLRYLYMKIGWDENVLLLSHLPAMLEPFAIPAPLQDRMLYFLGLLSRQRFSATKPPMQNKHFCSEELLFIINQLDAYLHEQTRKPVAVFT